MMGEVSLSRSVASLNKLVHDVLTYYYIMKIEQTENIFTYFIYNVA